MKSAAAVIICFIFSTFIDTSHQYETDFTFNLDSGKRECFHQDVEEDELNLGQLFLEVEYQVIDGGDLNINFEVRDTQDQLLVGDVQKYEAEHKVEIKSAGEYKICFDNSGDRFSNRLVYFELIVNREGSEDDEFKDIDFSKFSATEDYGMAVADIETALSRIRSLLGNVIHYQESKRAIEARHRSIAESNFTRVNTWSAVQSVVMVGVAFLQVFTIRNLFETNSPLSKLMKQST